MDKIKLGFVPTRRSIFSAPDAIKYRGLTADRLREIGVDIVDIDDINDEGLLFDDSHIEPIVKKFRAEGVDGIMLCHANFGTEYVCARLARELGLPVLLWGPRDERPEPDGTRLRDSQCGLFATGKVLRRFQVPFTYMTNCRLTDPEFERGVWDFLAVCNVVKTFKHTRILQMATRPFDFWSTMCNEGELLEKFNIQLSPIPMTELVQAVRDAQADEQAMAAMLAHINDSFEICIPEDKVPAVAGLAIAMKREVWLQRRCHSVLERSAGRAGHYALRRQRHPQRDGHSYRMRDRYPRRHHRADGRGRRPGPSPRHVRRLDRAPSR